MRWARLSTIQDTRLAPLAPSRMPCCLPCRPYILVCARFVRDFLQQGIQPPFWSLQTLCSAAWPSKDSSKTCACAPMCILPSVMFEITIQAKQPDCFISRRGRQTPRFCCDFKFQLQKAWVTQQREYPFYIDISGSWRFFWLPFLSLVPLISSMSR